jgi:hypothetical protein
VHLYDRFIERLQSNTTIYSTLLHSTAEMLLFLLLVPIVHVSAWMLPLSSFSSLSQRATSTPKPLLVAPPPPILLPRRFFPSILHLSLSSEPQQLTSDAAESTPLTATAVTTTANPTISTRNNNNNPTGIILNNNSNTTTLTNERPPCFYKTPQGKWQPRIDYATLKVGQLLNATVFQPLFEGKTGPKLWLDVGVARFGTGKWHLQTAMLRMDARRNKIGVVRKQAQRLAQKTYFAVYVSRILPANGYLEVSLDHPSSTTTTTANTKGSNKATQSPGIVPTKSLKPVSSLRVGQVVNGTVDDVRDVGVLIRVDGINRPGLLPIRKVGHVLGRFVAGQQGLTHKDTPLGGFHKGMRVQLQVMELSTTKRFVLDFTNTTYEALRPVSKRTTATTTTTTGAAEVSSVVSSTASDSTLSSTTTGASTSKVIAEQQDEEYDDDEEEEEEYDEDRDIEDAMGLGYY